MQRFFIAATLAAALVMPVAAQAGNIPTTGARIGLFAPPATFPANTAFHVTQGFTCEAGKAQCLSGLTHFDLYLDGRQVPSTVDLTFGDNGTLFSKFDLSDFPSGLPAGQHVFVGEWYYLGVLVMTQTVAIDFV